MQCKKLALIGSGDRGMGMYARPITNTYTKTAKLVALVDVNPKRAQYCASKLPYPVPVFTDMTEMIKATKPDGIIVTTPDAIHAQYVIAGLKAGLRVFTEKALCTTAAQCREIVKTARQTGGTVYTTHNARYGAACTTVRELIKSGVLGEIRWMQLDETLDKNHGGDYFRRWHRHKAMSGGLQIHKASHHFDLLNWWSFSKPIRVMAQGGLRFYGKNNPFHGKRCRGCKYAPKCSFYADPAEERYGEHYKNMYLKCEDVDGYFRDNCVWDPTIDIEDQFAANIVYANGIQCSYSLVAYSAIESMRVTVEGTKGRLEMMSVHDGSWALGNKKNRFPNMKDYRSETVRLFVPPKPIKDIPLKSLRGSHGGADPLLQKDLFVRDWNLKPNEMMASLDQAVQAILVGHAVNKSLATGEPVDVQNLLKKD